ncbi:MAG TPA: SMI1/KNR4 family protein [Planctomicrobium sp.]|nr:SMI1/KNR4 family protein [Planctomicrobium sp.]
MNAIEFAYAQFCEKRFLPLPEEKDLQNLEERLGCILPAHFREFVLQYNGGRFSDPYIDLPSIGSPMEDGLNVIYGFNASHKSYELGNSVRVSIFNDGDHVEVLPIGDTPVGNAILLDVDSRAETYGSIWFKATDDHRHYPGEWLIVGETMEEFFGLLKEYTGGD